MSTFGLAIWSHQINHFGTQEDIEKHADQLQKWGVDILIPCVKNGPGAVDFLTEKTDVNPKYPQWDPFKLLTEACQKRGIKVHAWFCVFPEGKQSKLLREHPEYAAKLEEKVSWSCACRPEVQDYVYDLYEDVTRSYRPAGLHLDFIRTGGPGNGLCRCAFCEKEMKARDVDVHTITPRDLAFEHWTEWRSSRVTDFVSRVHKLTQREGMELSAAVYSKYPECIRTQGQDWVRWAEMGIIDYLFPMTYTNSTRDLTANAISHVAQVKGRVPVWEGLGKTSSMSMFTTEVLEKQVQGTRDAGAQGVVLFQYPFITDEDIEAIRAIQQDATLSAV